MIDTVISCEEIIFLLLDQTNRVYLLYFGRYGINKIFYAKGYRYSPFIHIANYFLYCFTVYNNGSCP